MHLQFLQGIIGFDDEDDDEEEEFGEDDEEEDDEGEEEEVRREHLRHTTLARRLWSPLDP